MQPHRLALASCLALGACAGASSDFADVRHTVRSRLALEVPESPPPGDTLAHPLTAPDAVRTALLYNRDLAARLEDLGVARAALVQATAPTNPSVSGAYRIHDGQQDRISLGAMVDLADAIRIPLRRGVAEADLDAARARAAADVLDLAAAVRLAHVDYQASLEALALRRQIVEAFGAARDTARALGAAGNVPAVEVTTTETVYEEASVGVAEEERRVRVRREHLAALMGLVSSTGIDVPPRLPEPDDVALDEAHAESRAVERSLDLAAVRHDVTARGRAIGAARMEALVPVLGIGISAERDEGGHWGVGPAASLTLPLFDQGGGRTGAAEAEERRAHATLDGLDVRIRAAARAAHAAVVAEHDRATRYHDVILPLHDRLVEETREQHGAMQVSTFALLAAKRDAIAAALGAVEARRRYWRARVALDTLLAGRVVDVESLDDGELPETTTTTDVEVR